MKEKKMLEQGDVIRIPENEVHTGIWCVSKISGLSIEFENMDKTAMNSNFSIYDFGCHRDKLQEQLHFQFVGVKSLNGCVDCDACMHRSEDCLCDISENDESCPLVDKEYYKK